MKKYEFQILKYCGVSKANVIANYLDLEHVVAHSGLYRMQVLSETEHVASFILVSRLGPFKITNVHYFEFRPPDAIFQALKTPLGPMTVLATTEQLSFDADSPESRVTVDVTLELPWYVYPFRRLIRAVLERADRRVLAEDNAIIERRERLFGDYIEDYLHPDHPILFKDAFRKHFSKKT